MDNKSLFEKLEINLEEISLEQLSNYTAVEYFLTIEDEPSSDVTNLEKVNRYLESFHHLCEVENWDAASKILFSPLEIFDGNHLSLQLDTWNYYQKEISLSQKLLHKLAPTVDIDCYIVMGDGYIDLGQYDKAFEAYQNGLKISRKINDSDREITNLLCLGLICDYQGKYCEAVEYYQEGLNTNIKLEDLTTEYLFLKAKILGNLGMTYYNLDKYDKSVDCNENSLNLFRQLGDKKGEALALISVGRYYYTLGDYEQGLQCGKQALDIAQEIEDRSSEAEALNILGMIYRGMENYQQAIDSHQEQIFIAREIGDLREEGHAMGNLSIVYEKLEDYPQSANYAHQFLSISQKLGDRRGEGAALHSFGIALLELSHFSEALETLQTALEIFREVASQSEEAQTLIDLAIVYWELDEEISALQYCNQALALATELGIPLAKDCQELKDRLLNG